MQGDFVEWCERAEKDPTDEDSVEAWRESFYDWEEWD